MRQNEASADVTKRPTVLDLAAASGVSRSTVNRVINDASKVRKATRDRVLHAAQDLGFYGLGAIAHSVGNAQDTHHIGVILLQRHRMFYRGLANALQTAADNYPDAKVKLSLVFLEDLSPETVAQRLLDLGNECQAIAIVASEHPLVSDAIENLAGKGIPVWGLLAPLSSQYCRGYVGLDAWKVGRTAAWAIDKMCRSPGKLGILVGSHRFRNQDLNESGFRSYFREHTTDFTLLEARSTYENAGIARELTEELLDKHADMCGLFVAGGGITGVLSALRNHPKSRDLVSIGYDLFGPTREALIDGTLTLVISHPITALASEAVSALVRSKRSHVAAGTQSIVLGFDLYSSENV